jgi:hypothetical protein
VGGRAVGAKVLQARTKNSSKGRTRFTHKL